LGWLLKGALLKPKGKTWHRAETQRRRETHIFYRLRRIKPKDRCCCERELVFRTLVRRNSGFAFLCDSASLRENIAFMV